METLGKSINQLIEETLEMEKVQDLRLQKMIEEAVDPCNQSQPLPEEEIQYTWTESQKEENIQKKETDQTSEDLLEKSLDFYPTEKSIAKRQKVRYLATRIKYSPTRVKSRNFLSNISYTSINKADFYNENFILDVYILLVKNLNPFSLQRKTSDKLKLEMIYMLWRGCIPVEFRFEKQLLHFV